RHDLKPFDRRKGLAEKSLTQRIQFREVCPIASADEPATPQCDQSVGFNWHSRKSSAEIEYTIIFASRQFTMRFGIPSHPLTTRWTNQITTRFVKIALAGWIEQGKR